MALPGLKSTLDFVTDERPKNWREGIMLLEPRSKMPLFTLTNAMKSEMTDDPEFYWWEETQEMYNLTLNADLGGLVTDTALTIVNGGTKVKAGDLFKSKTSGEVMRVVSVASDTSITVERKFGPAGTPAGTLAALDGTPNTNDSAKLYYIGSAYAEGSNKAAGTNINPTKRYNLTQIFRTPLEITRTAAKTRYRTGDPWKNQRRRAMHKHGLAIEQAFWFGTQMETFQNGQPIRTTDGLLNRIPAANIKTVTAGGVDMEELENYFEGIFSYGNKEKLAFCSLKTLIIISQIVRKNSEYQWGPNEMEYKMNVKRLYTPAGTLVLTEHPLFGKAGDLLAEDMVVLDTDNFKYRYIDDTTLLKDRQDNSTDGMSEEYLTECGLEFHLPETHYWLKGFKKATKDD